MKRSEEREQAFALLFEQSFQQDTPMAELIKLSEEAEVIQLTPFTESLATGTEAHLEALDEKINAYSVDWSLHRMSKVTLSLLRLALYEMLFDESIPVGVSINEAVELAKKYASEEDAAFINGILGSVSREGTGATE